MTTENKTPVSRLVLFIFIVVLLLTNIFSIAATYFWQKDICTADKVVLNNKISQQAAKIAKPSPTPYVEPTERVYSFAEVESLFEELAKKDISFNTRFESVEAFRPEGLQLDRYFPELPKGVSLFVTAYRYQKDAHFMSGYEGGEWVVDLEKWKNWLKGLAVGKNNTKQICSSWGCSDYPETHAVIVKKINANKYVVADGYFQPALSKNRSYTTFNERNNTILDMRIDYDREADEKMMKNLFLKIEKLLP